MRSLLFIYILLYGNMTFRPLQGAGIVVILKTKGVIPVYQTTLISPVGTLTLASDGTALTGLWIEGQKYFAPFLTANAQENAQLPVFQQTAAWLDSYFSGEEDLPPLPPLSPQGSPFRQAVWKLLLAIPSGETTTYGALTKTLQAAGIAASAQAVGGAVGHNPILILIPCHRVLGADGSLTGYAGGLDTKRFLLDLEHKRNRDR